MRANKPARVRPLGDGRRLAEEAEAAAPPRVTTRPTRPCRLPCPTTCWAASAAAPSALRADDGRRGSACADPSRAAAARCARPPGDSPCLTVVGRGAGAVRCISSSVSRSLARNGSCPVSISKNSTPSAYRSDCGPACSPRACSGDMYSGVPNTAPFGARRGSCASAARPKSRIFTKSLRPPRAVSRMLSLFRSRWTTPRSCAREQRGAHLLEDVDARG